MKIASAGDGRVIPLCRGEEARRRRNRSSGGECGVVHGLTAAATPAAPFKRFSLILLVFRLRQRLEPG